MTGESVSLTYWAVMAAATPIVRWWGRLSVVGGWALPTCGPSVLVANHDSAWDPLALEEAAAPGVRAFVRRLRRPGSLPCSPAIAPGASAVAGH